MPTTQQKKGLFILIIGVIIGIAFFIYKKKKNSKKSGKKKNSKKKNSSVLSSSNNSPKNVNLINNSPKNVTLINNSTNSLSNNSAYEPKLNNNKNLLQTSSNNSNKPDLNSGTSLICPPNTQKGGLICYEKCRSNEQWDGTHTCYTNPTNWAGGQTLTHLQHKSYPSQLGIYNTLPTKCSGADEFHDGLCYKVPDNNPKEYEYQSPGLYKNKCKKDYYWNGTTCWRDPKRTGITLYGWIWGDKAFNYTQAGNRCKAANPQGCRQVGAIWYPDCPPGQRPDGTSCWRDVHNYGGVRSVIGTLPTGCTGGKEKRGGFCYQPCNDNYERRDDNIEFCQTKCPSNFTYIGIGGCQKPSRMISSKGTIGSVGVCPSTHPIKLNGVCYKKK
jgi:hypothetical protein